MKQALRTVVFSVFALFLAVSGFFIIPLDAQENSCSQIYGDMSYPTLTAVITSPSDGAVIKVGDCFEVTATITVTCPELTNNFGRSRFSSTVYASTRCDVQDVTATIEIQGNAAISDTTTKIVSSGMNCPGGPSEYPSQATVSWQVCCTGTGSVTITVTPAGNTAYATKPFDYNQIIAGVISPVYAIDHTPLPSDHLISDTITITQEGEDFSQKLIKETSSGPSWANPSHVTTVNTWANTQTARAGQQVIVYANIANRGDIEGPYTATLSINGAVEEVKTGMLQGNTGIPLKFVVSRDEPGTYEVDVNGQKAYFTVIGKTASEGVSSRDLPLTIALIIVASLIAVLVMLIIRRRQHYLS